MGLAGMFSGPPASAVREGDPILEQMIYYLLGGAGSALVLPACAAKERDRRRPEAALGPGV